jgi:flagellar hook-associated protein 3 FlgL
MRDLAKVYTMVVDVGAKGLNQNAYQAMVDEAITVVNSAIQGLITTQAQLGSAQSRVSSASERLTIQRDIMAKQIMSFESVDPYEAKVRVDQLTTQIETSYSLTVRFQNLSILKYMS